MIFFHDETLKWALSFLGLALIPLPAQGPQRVLVQKSVVLLHRADIQGKCTFCVAERRKDESGRGSEIQPEKPLSYKGEEKWEGKSHRIRKSQE
jgi:hypothetical protein